MVPLTNTKGDLPICPPHHNSNSLVYMAFHEKLWMSSFSTSSPNPYPTIVHTQAKSGFVTKDRLNLTPFFIPL
ncbi:hypothetical protein MTP99_018912 [Tenebrio molitor]|nr:hypothetical protein MTP99_018912 [Tenebrio molitor]